jgi:acetyltransferase AlgX (SGNH hydrolase-like protein)
MRRYLVYFSATVLGLALLLMLVALAFGTFERLTGDLTRIGFYPERDFGWNAVQPAIDILPSRADARDADVLVLGDSFSEDNAWQSILSARTGRRLSSFQYADDDCFDDFVQFAIRHAPSDLVIVETVERRFSPRFGETKSCAVSKVRPVVAVAGKTPETRAVWPPELHVNQTIRGALNVWKMNAKPQALLATKMVVNVPLVPNCARFSNRRSDRILYYKEDEEKSRWTVAQQQHAVEGLARLHQTLAAHGKRMLVVVVPDKSTVYRDCLPASAQSATFNGFKPVQALKAAGVPVVDLLPDFTRRSKEVVDFYNPNDTHLSAWGFVALADGVQAYFQEVRH